jgi:hypothetical protein
MTTGHRIETEIVRNRKRPRSTATNSKIAQKSFKGSYRKELAIPLFIDDYNHYMRGVDQANQLRAAFTTNFVRN